MELSLLYFLPVFIGWSLPFFLIKNLTSYFTSMEIIVLIHFVYSLFIIPLTIFLYKFYRKESFVFIDKLKKINKKLVITLISLVLIGIISRYFINLLLNIYDVSFTIPIIRGFSFILIILFGLFIFEEEITLRKILGILIITFGIYILAQKSSDKTMILNNRIPSLNLFKSGK